MKKKSSPRNAFFPPYAINEVQMRNYLVLVRWILPSKPVAYIHSFQKTFVIAVTVSITSRLLGNQAPSTGALDRPWSHGIFQGIRSYCVDWHGCGRYILPCRIFYMVNGKEMDERWSFLNWQHKLPPIAESYNRKWMTENSASIFLKKKKTALVHF